MHGTYFQKLKSLCADGRLSIRLIISPPRANSSLIEHVLGNSPDIDIECHEPFIGARKSDFNPDDAYKNMYDTVRAAMLEHPQRKINIIIKEMSQWVGVQDEYKDLFSLSAYPILFLIRNPLLCEESRIRKTIGTLHAKERPYLGDWLLKHTNDTVEALRGIAEQQQHLDRLARESGYVDWNALVQAKLFVEKDYGFFAEVLDAKWGRLPFDASGFEDLERQVAYMDAVHGSHVVVDTTDMRAYPQKMIDAICERLRARTSPAMLEWGASESVDFHSDQTKSSDIHWYDVLRQSSTVNPPTEQLPILDSFPPSTQERLLALSIPAYYRLSQKKIRCESAAETNARIFEGVSLRDIDPLYATVNEPTLLDDANFRARHDGYNQIFNRITALTNTISMHV